ncbi:unnamed protein product [Spirodela intermedia]|uniref:Uncharacterized protein n=2 Tax=Spirodela intermedia TaxID=51605 RepID=A0ABN7E9G2_SPIIN|nr:unnamed protein product [Spirodela intermedia]CAA7399791.1 unnamed protein product [Spirodela intermedia]
MDYHKKALLSNESLSHMCTTTLCPMSNWPLVTWKGSDTHIPSSIHICLSPDSRLHSDYLLAPMLGLMWLTTKRGGVGEAAVGE